MLSTYRRIRPFLWISHDSLSRRYGRYNEFFPFDIGDFCFISSIFNAIGFVAGLMMPPEHALTNSLFFLGVTAAAGLATVGIHIRNAFKAAECNEQALREYSRSEALYRTLKVSHAPGF